MYTDIFDRIRKSTGGPIGQYLKRQKDILLFLVWKVNLDLT